MTDAKQLAMLKEFVTLVGKKPEVSPAMSGFDLDSLAHHRPDVGLDV